MPRAQKMQTNFSTGEVSPLLLGRVDIARYQNAVKIMENFYPLVQGGARRHPGTRYIGSTKTHAKKSRLVPFVFSASQAYQLEFGDLYMRVFADEGQVMLGGVPYEIVTPYSEANLPDLNWVQSSDTAFLVHPAFAVRKLSRSGSAAWKLAQFVFLVEPHDELGTKPATNLTLGAVTGTGITATAAAAAFEAADVGRQITAGDGVATIVGYTSTTVVTVDISADFAAVLNTSGNWTLTESPKTGVTPSAAGPEGTAVTLTLDVAGWKNTPTTDVGRYVHLNGGMVEITGFVSATVVNGLVRAILTGTAKAASAGWSMETKVWNAVSGYPRAVTLFEQRLVLAGTTAFPNRVWASRTGRYNDFTTGSADNDALDLDMVSDQQNPIMQLAPLRALMPLTYGGEFSIRGGVEKPLTATNNQAKPESQYGIKNVRPVRVGNDVLFVQRAGRKIRSLGYTVEKDAFISPDRTKLSEHITKGGITGMCYSQEPDSLVWMVRSDGQAVTMAINLEDDAQVLGFSRRVTDGVIESLSVIPYNYTDQVWAIINRTIGGVTARYVELFDPALNTDSASTGTSGPGSAVWTDLGHLNGKTVDIVGDGVVFPQQVVNSGTLTLPRAVHEFEMGLPYRSTLTLLNPELPMAEGSTQARPVSVSEFTVRLFETVGGSISSGGKPLEKLPGRQFGVGVLDQPLVPFTGDKKVNLLGWDRTVDIDIVQDQPLPMTVLAAIYKLSVGD